MFKFAAGIRLFAPNLTIPIAILAAGLSLSGCGLVGDSGGRTRALSITPSAATFGSVTVKTDATQTIKISNTGTGELKILNADITGTGFSLSGMSVPTKLAAGASATFNVAFKPMAAGSTKGSLSIKTNASESPATVNLSGTGVEESIKLTVNETSLSFGSVLVSGSETKEVKITNSGNANATITAVTVSGAGFSVSGGSGVTLAPNQSETVTVNFNPKSKGSLSGTLTVSSNAQTVNVALGGTGMPGGNHSVRSDMDCEHVAGDWLLHLSTHRNYGRVFESGFRRRFFNELHGRQCCRRRDIRLRGHSGIGTERREFLLR